MTVIKDRRDFVGGILLIAAGLTVALYAYFNYRLGSVQRMGPGMFPFGAGLTMALIGGLVLLPALLRASGEAWVWLPARQLVFIIASIIAFALTVPHFGLMPAIAILVGLSSLAVKGARPVAVLVLAISMGILAYLIFILGLKLPIQLFRLPL